jgi:hypothetical protein
MRQLAQSIPVRDTRNAAQPEGALDVGARAKIGRRRGRLLEGRGGRALVERGEDPAADADLCGTRLQARALRASAAELVR